MLYAGRNILSNTAKLAVISHYFIGLQDLPSCKANKVLIKSLEGQQSVKSLEASCKMLSFYGIKSVFDSK